jgi:hypothetical protein
MTFQEAALKATGIEEADIKSGISAMEGVDRPRITATDPRVFTHSLNLDKSLKPTQPNAARWDYGIGLKIKSKRERAIWVEVHPASTSEVKKMLGKFNWLRSWLRDEAQDLEAVTRQTGSAPAYNWIATGKVAIPRNSRQARLLAQSGLPYPVKHLTIR